MLLVKAWEKDNRMIIVKIDAGMGNQMLEYCFFKQLKDQLPECVIKADMDRWIYKKYVPHHGYELKRVFGIEFADVATTREILACGGEYQRKNASPFDVLKKKYHNHIGFRLRGDKTFRLHQSEWNAFYEEHKDSIGDYDCWIDNSWNWIYEPAISDFKYILPLKGANLEAAGRMRECDSVSVHIRRGDYVGGSLDKLKKDYYLNVMEYVSSGLSDPVFFFFSDDPEYIKKEYGDIPYKYEIIDWNKGEDSHYDMMLMSACKNNIMCNSSFSLWGAILNKNPGKIVIRPDVLSDALIPHEEGWYSADIKGLNIRKCALSAGDTLKSI